MDLAGEDHGCQATPGRRKRKLGSREMEESLKRTANKRGCAAEVVKCRMKCRSNEGEEQHGIGIGKGEPMYASNEVD